MAVVRVTLQRASSGFTGQAAATWFASVAGTEAQIDLETIDSLMVTLDRIEFQMVSDDEGDDGDGDGDGDGDNGDGDGDDDGNGQWQSLDVEDVRLNLLALPSTDETGIVLAIGELPVGDYAHLRMFVTEPLLWLNTPLQIGNAAMFEPDVGHVVTIPSHDQTGIKSDQGFSVPEGGGDVLLVFDEDASLANIHGTGNGRVMMAPVLRVHGEQ
jgi:hypothetical protein